MLHNKNLVAPLTELQREIFRYTMLEVTWIMTNIGCGPIEIVEKLFFSESEQSYMQPEIPTAALRIVEICLTNNDNGGDLELWDLVLQVTANCMIESEKIS